MQKDDTFASDEAEVGPMFRAALMRVVSGSQMLAGIFAACVAVVSDHNEDKTSCALSAATCLVAFYHYNKLIEIRENTARFKRADLVELEVDSVRFSDWAITLTPLILDLHMMRGSETNGVSVGTSALLCILMVALGAWGRLGLDDLYSSPFSTRPLLFLSGVLTFAASCGCLALVLNNLLGGLSADASNGWEARFSLPWIGYGVVALVAVLARQTASFGEYPVWLSVGKDVVLGLLDIWSKAAFAVYIGLKAMEKEDELFAF